MNTILLGQFALGYLAILAAPGPNMLAVGSLAALRGLRGVLPFCCGIALGAGALAWALQGAFQALDAAGLERAGRAVGAVLLLLIALRVTAAPRPVSPAEPQHAAPAAPGRRAALIGFAGGFLTALTNPITGTYLLSQFLGPLAAAPAGTVLAATLLVPVQALAVATCVAAVFARRHARRVALAHHRLLCLLAGLALSVLAAGVARPLLG
jgi:threonine/homoserine/homoserine lactone efflux protein